MCVDGTGAAGSLQDQPNVSKCLYTGDKDAIWLRGLLASVLLTLAKSRWQSFRRSTEVPSGDAADLSRSYDSHDTYQRLRRENNQRKRPARRCKRVGRGSREDHVRRPPEEPRPAHGATKIYDSRGPAPQAQEELPVLRGVRRTAPVAAK